MSNQHKVLTRQGYIVSKSKIQKSKIEEVKRELSVTPVVNKDYSGDPETFNVYKENDKSLCVPRYYGINKFGKPLKELPMDETKSKMKFKGVLRPAQQLIADKCLEDIKEKGGGVISLHTGAGKTVVALYLASKLGLKTLVIVHKTFLQNQWYERIEQFTTARIGTIRQKKKDVKNKDVVVGMLQSISLIDYDPSVFSDFGLIIVDECHRTSSKVFSKAYMKTGAKYTIGLSATPYRADGLTKVFNWYLGDIIYRLERKKDNKVLIKIFNYESSDKLFCEKKRWINGGIKPDIVKMITNMYKIDSRNKFIINLIDKVKNQDERKILILSGRLEHLKILKQGVDELIQKQVDSGDLEPDEFRSGYYIGGMKEYQLKDSEECDIIFATYAMAEEGLDIDKLNTLILATPKKDVVQSIGRVMRKPIEEGDTYPMIIDIIDQFSCFESWGSKRKQYYGKNKYSISYYQAFNNNCISIKDFMINKNIVKKDNVLNDDDIRKEYMVNIYGEDHYEFEKEMGFEDDPIEKYNYKPDLNIIFSGLENDVVDTEYVEPKEELVVKI